MPEQETPPSAPATGTPGTQPATGTPASGATPTKPTTTIEEALARIAELERHSKNKEEEASRHGKNLTTAEKELAVYKEKERLAQEATLSEIDKASKRAQELEALNQQYKQQLISSQVRLAAQAKGIINPDIAALAIQDKLEAGSDGMPTNVDKALDELIKGNPYLVKAAEAPAETPPASPAQTVTPPALQTPAIPAMNPGRTSIAAPNQLPPGQPVRLDQLQWKRRP